VRELEGWVAEIERAVAGVSAVPSMGFGESTGRALSRAVASRGFLGVLPLWSTGGRVVGLWADPEASPEIWPGVVLADGQALTVASDSSTLLPQIIVQQFSSDPDAVRRLTTNWTKYGSAVESLHERLGGSSNTLDIVIGAASDSTTLEAFNYSGDTADFEEAHSELSRKIDRSASFKRYAGWLDGAVAGRYTAPVEPARYGSWGRRVLCWANRLSFTRPSTPGPSVDQLWQVVEGHAGLDSGVPTVPSWAVEPGGASGEGALIQAAMTIDHYPPADDPLRRGLLRALLSEGSAYRGLAHAEATVALDERGEPERAWAVMQSAAWWAARNMSEVPDVFLLGARFLAESHHWADILTVLDRASGG
jgi:hypothetical protein